MDAAAYKDLRTSRGLIYHYFFAAPNPGTPTLLFLHGFPSASEDWTHQVTFFCAKGFGVVAPDLLGYGGSSRPCEVEAYRMSLMCQDIMDVLDHEGVQSVVGVGHDWGSGLLSRLATYHPERFTAFAFIAVPCRPPAPDFDIEKVISLYRKALGNDTFGFWLFFCEDEAEQIIAAHFNSFFSVAFTGDPTLWRTVLTPVGALKAWCLADKTAPLAPFVDEAFMVRRKNALLEDRMHGALCWFKAIIQKVTPAEERGMSADSYTIPQPVFFAAVNDYLGRVAISKAAIQKHCPNHTIVDFGTGHWVQLEAPDKLNEEILKWVERLS